MASSMSYQTDVLWLARRVVHLHTPSPQLRALLIPSLAHLLIPDIGSSPELIIWYAEEKDLAFKLKAPPWEGFNGQGYNANIPNDDIQIFFQPWQKQIFLYSRSRHTGIYWVQTAEELPWWEATFSFRIIFHFWTHNLPAQLIHAGAIAHDGAAVLITGKSGSGKSTSCLQLLRSGYQYLGDDYVWVETEKPHPTVHTLYQTAKIEPDNLEERFSEWFQHVSNSRDYKQQKAIFHMQKLFPDTFILSAPLKVILLPKVYPQKNTAFTKTNSVEALMAMAPTTLHHLPHHRELSYQKMMTISGSIPTYRWLLGADLENFKQTFKDFSRNELSLH